MYLKQQINHPIKLNFFKKLFLLTIGIVFLTIIISFIFNYLFYDKFYIHRKQDEILKIRTQIVSKIENPDELKNYITFAEDSFGVKIDLNIIQNNKSHMMSNRKIFNSLKVNETSFKIREVDDGSGVMFIRFYERLPKGYLLSIRSSMAVMNKHIHDLFIFNIFTAFISLFIGGLLVSFVAKRINRNITYLKNSAEKISRLEYPDNISLKSGDELESLAESLNEMSKNLFNSIDNLKLFVSNASHELKTPISVLCLYSQALARNKVEDSKKKEYYKVILEKSLEMRTLTESLLTLSKINSPDYKISSENINLKDVINLSLEQFDYIEFEKNLEILTDLKNIQIFGDINLIKIAINNLVQNMLKYSPQNEPIEINLTSEYLIFKNSINDKVIKNSIELFEPFYRGDNALNQKIEGSGLGLSIVKKILELHKLKFTLDISSNYFIFKIFLNEKTD